MKQVRTATRDATDWRSLAACGSADPDVFFPISSAGPALDQVSQAKAICAVCRVRRPCLDFALATGQIHGVWGGTTEQERLLLRRHQAAAGPRPGESPQTPPGPRQGRQRHRRHAGR